MSLLIVLSLTLAVFARVGWESQPIRERMPFTQWRALDLFANAHRGLVLCSKSSVPSDRLRPDPWGTPAGPSQPVA
ncbi:hypothetical protein [Arthrobacter sp. CAN_C5]|uniref:hypothetical protein n=1 Tax=Arthrobacter sp. CAN_C5 TaxID=2760706 RepID=UPI001AE159DB|nr:hypothetical protein [Arthrobacter sp. CAN_C5]MBP2216965.1 hypothetical protein [Arthrobacter sp. CAN_C5]